MKTLRDNTMWAVKGRWRNGREFFYAGLYFTRTDALRAHGELNPFTNDKVVRVCVTELPQKPRRPTTPEAK